MNAAEVMARFIVYLIALGAVIALTMLVLVVTVTAAVDEANGSKS